MFGMLSVLAELQPELIVTNTRDGLAAARARGRNGGRRPKLNAAQAAHAQQLYDGRQHKQGLIHRRSGAGYLELGANVRFSLLLDTSS